MILDTSRGLNILCTKLSHNDLADSESFREMLHAICKKAEWLDTKSKKGCLALKRLREGGKARIDIKELVRGLEVDPHLKYRVLTRFRMARTVPEIEADEIHLTAALGLLVENACEHRDSGSKSITIGLTYRHSSHRVHFWVQNRGSFTEPVRLSFRHDEPSISSKKIASDGSGQRRGYGLKLAKKIITQELGGNIMLRNVSKGKQKFVRVDVLLPKTNNKQTVNHESKS